MELWVTVYSAAIAYDANGNRSVLTQWPSASLPRSS